MEIVPHGGRIERWPASGAGRSRACAIGSLVWVVGNATDSGSDFRTQVTQTLNSLDLSLEAAGSSRSKLLSVQVLLADIGTKPAFEDMWQAWVGPDSSSWPQRSCVQVGLSPGLFIEITAIATRG